MNCAHVLGLIDAGSLACPPPGRRGSARRHARQCPTCGPAMAAAASLTRDLDALPRMTVPPDVTAAILARVAVAEQRRIAPASAPAPAAYSPARDWGFWATTLASFVVGLLSIGSTAQRTEGPVAAAPGLAGMSGHAPVMALLLVAALGLYAAGLFAPLREPDRA